MEEFHRVDSLLKRKNIKKGKFFNRDVNTNEIVLFNVIKGVYGKKIEVASIEKTKRELSRLLEIAQIKGIAPVKRTHTLEQLRNILSDALL